MLPYSWTELRRAIPKEMALGQHALTMRLRKCHINVIAMQPNPHSHFLFKKYWMPQTPSMGAMMTENMVASSAVHTEHVFPGVGRIYAAGKAIDISCWDRAAEELVGCVADPVITSFSCYLLDNSVNYETFNIAF